MTKAGESMIRRVMDALAFAQGKKDHGCIAHIPDEINVQRIRKKASMSQSEFADYFGVNKRTVQEWEQGRRVPTGAARAFLTVIDKEPEAVRRALTSTAASRKEPPSNHLSA
jgi:putative transcriptional regulator